MATLTNPTHSDTTVYANFIARKGAVPLYGQNAIDMIANALYRENGTDTIEDVTNPVSVDARTHNTVVRFRSTAGSSVCGMQLRPRWYPEGGDPTQPGIEWDTPRTAGERPEIWLRLRLYINIDASFASGDDVLFLMGGDLNIDAWADISNRQFDVRAIHDGTSVKLGYFVAGGGGSATSTTACPLDQWFDLEFYFRHESSNNAGDGAIRLRIRETSGSGDWTELSDITDTSLDVLWASDVTRLLIGSSNTDTSGTNEVFLSHVEWSMDGANWFDDPTDTIHSGWVEDQGIAVADKTDTRAAVRVRLQPGRFNFSHFTHYRLAYREAGSSGSWTGLTAALTSGIDAADPFFIILDADTLTPDTRYEFRIEFDTADSFSGSEIGTSVCYTKTLRSSAAPTTVRMLLFNCVYQNFQLNDLDPLYYSSQYTTAFDAVVLLGDNIYEGGLSFSVLGESDAETEDDYRRQYDRLFHAHGFRHVARTHGVFHQADDHEWGDNGRFTSGETPYLDIYTGVTWTQASSTLTKTGEFGEYGAGDTVYVQGGTGATTGRYTVSSATANTIVLTGSIGAGADGQTDIQVLCRRDFCQAGIDQWQTWFGDGMLNTVTGADAEDLNYERQFSVTPNTRIIIDETRSEIGYAAAQGGGSNDLLSPTHETWSKARLNDDTHIFNFYCSPAYWPNHLVNSGNNPNENWGTSGSNDMRGEMEAIMAAKSGRRFWVYSGDRHTPYEILSHWFGTNGRTGTTYGAMGTITSDPGSLFHHLSATASSGRWSIDGAFQTYKQSATVGDFEPGVLAALDIDDAGGIDANDYIRAGGIIVDLNEASGSVSYVCYDDTGTNRLPSAGQGPFSVGVSAGGGTMRDREFRERAWVR